MIIKNSHSKGSLRNLWGETYVRRLWIKRIVFLGILFAIIFVKCVVWYQTP